MSVFISVSDAVESGSYFDQKTIRDEVADIVYRLRREMDAGLTPDDMKVVSAEKTAADAADEILSKIFE